MSNIEKFRPPGTPNAFGLPRGFFGILAGWLMGRTGVDHNTWAVSQLGVTAEEQVLEIGFGPGVSITLLAERAGSGHVVGVDPSSVMMGQARKRNAALIKAGRVELLQGDVSHLPFGDNRFDKVLSVNNVMLWSDVNADLGEILRVMKPGGLLVIALNPRWAHTSDDVREMGQEIAAHVTRVGFVGVNVAVRLDLKPFGAVAISAMAPARTVRRVDIKR